MGTAATGLASIWNQGRTCSSNQIEMPEQCPGYDPALTPQGAASTETSELQLFLNRTPANKPKPELNKAALQPPGDFAIEQFWEKKQQPNPDHWKLERNGDRSDSEGAGHGDECEW